MASFEEFRESMFTLIRIVIQKGDANGSKDKATIDKLSADLSAANVLISQLQAAIVAKDQAQSEALAAQSSELLGYLDTLSTDLSNEFNPTSTADAVAEAVQESPEIETPVEVTEATTIGTSEETPPEVAEAAIAAIEDSAED